MKRTIMALVMLSVASLAVYGLMPVPQMQHAVQVAALTSVGGAQTVDGDGEYDLVYEAENIKSATEIGFEIANTTGALTKCRLDVQYNPSGGWCPYLEGTATTSDWISTSISALAFCSTDLAVLGIDTNGFANVIIGPATGIRIYAASSAGTTVTVTANFK